MKKPIFITARFRSGSTLLWNIYRNAVGAHAYYEPLHEQLPELIKLNISPQSRHFFVDSYFKQYPNVDRLSNFHKSEFGVHRLFLETNDAYPEMRDYLRYLISFPPQNQTVVLQENRIDFRLAWIKSNFPEAILIHLYRSPRDQWISSIEGYPGNIDLDIDSDPYRITTWSRDLVHQFPFLASPFIRHPYQRHYYLWKLSCLMGKQVADFSLAYEDLLSEPKKFIRQLLEFGQVDTRENLENCLNLIVKRPVDVWKSYRPEDWFSELEQECERQLNSLGLNEDFGKTPLNKIIEKNLEYRDLMLDAQATMWGRKNSQVTIIDLLNVADQKEKILQTINSENKTIVEDLVAKEDLLQSLRGSFHADLTSLRTELVAKETVIQSFQHSLFFWLFYGPLGRFIPFRNWLLRLGIHIRFRSLIRNIRSRFSYKLGTLIQYPPRRLKIPVRYRQEARLPEDEFPVISMVTPSFNQAVFLDRTIQSILSQEYPRLEYVLQDGDSKDGSADILERYRSQLTHVESVRDGGQAHAINLGFRHTTGQIMAYMNSDDMLLPGTLHYVAKYFARHPHVDVVYGHRVIVDENDQEVGVWVLPPHDGKMLEWGDYVPQETMFWRREIWEKSGGKMDESFKFALDWDLLIRFQQAGARIVRLPRFLAVFRVHGAQKSTAQIHDLGLREMNLLRQQIHGRKVQPDEINSSLRPYLIRSVIYHKLYRLGLLRY